jgi:hypothetical protein
MQISRHWRMNAQRYRLVGVRYENGEVSLQDRRVSHRAQVNEVHAQVKAQAKSGTAAVTAA